MKIDGRLFFSFWSIISIIFLKLGFNAVDRTDLATSVPPAVMFLFKHVFAISVIHSSDYRLVNCRLVKIQDEHYWLILGVMIIFPLQMNLMGFPNLMVLPFLAEYGFFMFVLITNYEDEFCIGIDLLVKLTLIAYGDGWKFISLLVLLISCHTSDIWASVYEENERYNRLPMSQNGNQGAILTGKKNWKLVQFGARIVRSVMFQGENQSIWRMFRKRRKLVEFAFGMVGTILFQYFFQLKSLDHVLAFLYLAIAWLGNIALLGSSGDFGVLNFLLGNVIVGCTVNQFGLQGTTWIAYGASVFLYGMRVKFEEYVEEVHQGIRYIVW